MEGELSSWEINSGGISEMSCDVNWLGECEEEEGEGLELVGSRLIIGIRSLWMEWMWK